MQTIYLDISNKGAIPTIHAKQGDVGRRFLAVITDSGVPHQLDYDDLFSVWYDGDSGDGNYSEINGKSAFSVEGNRIAVELVAQMLTNPGKGILSLVINDPAGEQIGLWNIDYVVEAVPGMDSPEADQYYTAFLDAIKEMTLVGVESQSFPGCYYRVVNGETEWLNPPMEVDVEYRTTERYMGKAVYTTLVNPGVPINEKEVAYSTNTSAVAIRDRGRLMASSIPYDDGTDDWYARTVINDNQIRIYCGTGWTAYHDDGVTPIYPWYHQVWYTID